MKKIFTTIIFIFLVPAICFGYGIRTSWKADTDSDLKGYRIYYRTSPTGAYTMIDVGNVITYDIKNVLNNTTYYIAVSAYDTSGNESAKSTDVSLYIPFYPPTSPTINHIIAQ